MQGRVHGLELRTRFDQHHDFTIYELKKLCNAFGIIPRCTHTGSMDDVKFYFGYDVRRKVRFAEGLSRIFAVGLSKCNKRQVFGKRVACPWNELE